MPLTQQQFDTVLFGIRKQGGPSFGANGRCAYRGRNGRKCAAGLFIPDDRYSPSLESKAATHEDVSAVLEGGLDRSAVYALRSLQSLHDRAAKVERDDRAPFFPAWEPLMATFAAEYGLTYTPPEAV